MKIFFICVNVIVCFCDVGAMSTLIDAISGCVSGGKIEILQNIKVCNTLEIADKSIEIVASIPVIIERSEGFYGAIFNVRKDASLKITQNITFCGSGKYEEQTPFIRNSGKLELHEVILKKNGNDNGLYFEMQLFRKLEHVKGGALFNEGTAILENCLLQLNCAVYGGGIYNEGRLFLKETNLDKNRSVKEGGAIYSGRCLVAETCKISFNSSYMCGGGLYNAVDGDCTLQNVHFDKNILRETCCAANGGAVLNYGNMIAENCSFNNNIGCNGVGIYCAAGKCQLITCEIIGNKLAKYNYYMRFKQCMKEYIFLQGGLSSIYRGGGIYLGGGVFSLEDTKVSNNRAHVGGGAYYTKNAIFDMGLLQASILPDNRASEKDLAMIANEESVLQEEYMLAMMPSVICDTYPGEVMPVDVNGNKE